MFTPEEALAAALGLRTLRHLGLHALAPAAEAAGAKLARSLPTALQTDVQALEQGVQLSASPWVASTDAQLLATLLRAVRSTCRVAFLYAPPAAPPTLREADVYRVVHLDGRWYAVGLCHLRAALRCFRLDRMSELQLLSSLFTPPPGFDAAAYLRSTLRAPPPTVEVSVWLDCPLEELRGRVSVWATELVAEEGGTRLRAQRDQLASFAAFLLGLGCAFRVDRPPELHAEFRELANRCAAQLQAYRGASPAELDLTPGPASP